MNRMHRVLSSFSLSMVLIAMLATSVAACSAEKPLIEAVVEGNSAFAVDLYHQIRSAEGNLFFSPYSISMALAMTYAGARGKTERQMAEALHFSLPQEKLHAAFYGLQAVMGEVHEKGNVELLIANSLWPHKAYPFRQKFLELARRNYKTSIAALDYVRKTEEARQTINRWVEEKTKGNIQELIKPGVLAELTRLVLANAIYFKGNWASRFRKEYTRDMPFQTAPAKTPNVPMMYQRQEFAYHADAEVQVLEMPYAGKRLSMLVLLPRKVDGLAELEKNLSAAKLNQWTGKLQKTEVEIWFPRFRVTSEFTLNEKLEALGMVDAFSPTKANFSGMDGTRMLYISAALHKAFVEVNEEGTEAAAVTAVGMVASSVPRYPQFRANHPFLFLIRDRATDSVLFMGRIVDPTPNKQ
jgi:serine protease inhibitor